MNSITKKEIEHLAKLSNLPITKTESEKLNKLLSETINYIDILNELDTNNVKETYQVNNLKNVYQIKNQNRQTLSVDSAIKNANKVKDNLIVSMGVFAE